MANFNFNKVILGGRLTADPELKQTQSGVPFTSFSIAVSRRFVKQTDDPNQQTADFLNAVAWRQQAEFITRYFRKGSSICIVGMLQSRSWADQQGQKRFATDVVVDEVMFVDSKGEGQSIPSQFISQSGQNTATGAPSNYSTPSYSSPANTATGFSEMANDDDLPF